MQIYDSNHYAKLIYKIKIKINLFSDSICPKFKKTQQKFIS